MLSRLVLSSSTPTISASLIRSAIQNVPLRTQMCRQFQQESGQTFQTRAERLVSRRKTLKEWATEPAGPNGKIFIKLQTFRSENNYFFPFVY